MRALGIVGSAGGVHYYTFLEGRQQLNGSGPNRRGKYKSAYHKAAFSTSMLDAMYRGLTAPVRGADMSASLVQIDSYGGKINHGGFSPTDTAIPQRSSTAKLQYQTYWDTTLHPWQTDLMLERAHVGWINRLYTNVYAESGGFPDPALNADVDGCYYNYPDIDLGSTDPEIDQTVEHATRLYFGRANQERLVSVCRDYNPRGWLTNSQSVWNLLP